MGKVIQVDFNKKKEPEKTPEEAFKELCEANPDWLSFHTNPSPEEMVEHFSNLLDRGMAQLLIQPDRAIVPPYLQEEGEACLLNFSYKFGLDDFVFDRIGVTATLSFNKEPFYCIIPWNAVALIRPAS